MRTSLRLVVALSIAVLSSGLLLVGAPAPGAHAAFACAGMPTAHGDWCAPQRHP